MTDPEPRTADIVVDGGRCFGDRLRTSGSADEGFRRARILNLAALEARGDYIVFIDGDCIPRVGFLAAVRRAALPGWFLATKRIESQRVLLEPGARCDSCPSGGGRSRRG